MAVAPDLAGRALSWAVRRMAGSFPHRHAELVASKNAAYAWRQGIFFLSFCNPWATINWLLPQLTGTRLAPALAGLKALVEGDRFDDSGHVLYRDSYGHTLDEVRWSDWPYGRRWLGWTAID